jgi:cytochrome b6-f complex iron-sulfur subunit
MADKKRPSVAEILAMARKVPGEKPDAPAEEPAKPADAQSGEASVGDEHQAAPARGAQEAARGEGRERKPVAAGGAPAARPGGAKAAGRPSVKDILAMARAAGKESPEPAGTVERGAAGVEKAAVDKPAAPKPAAAKGAARPSAKAPAAQAGEKDTVSILAAARKASKPGPMSKAEAARMRHEPAEAADAAAAPAALATKAAPRQREAPPMPARPAIGRPKAEEEATAQRRYFLASFVGSFLAVGFTSLAATAGVWTLGLARFMFPNVLAEPPSRFKVGYKSDYAPGAVSEKFKAQFGVWIAKAEYNGQMQIYALKTVCTHLGCTPNWLESEQKFKCPCHGSGFYKDGINFEGPAPRPLERYAISLASDGQLEVDKSREFKEEMGQWKDSASYVKV